MKPILVQIHHSGYDLPLYFWDEQPAFHDAHHKKYKGVSLLTRWSLLPAPTLP